MSAAQGTPLGASRWRVQLDVPAIAGDPRRLTVRSLGDGEPAGRVETVAAPLPAADVALWGLTIALDAGRGAGSYRLSGEGAGPWSADVLLGPPTLSLPTPQDPPPEPRADIDYRARDFRALRTMLLQQAAARVGADLEAHPVAQTTALIELLAYLGDDLAYAQDAAATEAHLTTARSRISAVRHAELLDYPVRDGLSARTWIRAQAAEDALGPVPMPARTKLLSSLPGVATVVAESQLDALQIAGALVFETLSELWVRPGDPVLSLEQTMHPGSLLKAGATSATVSLAPDAPVQALHPGALALIAPPLPSPPPTGRSSAW